jgi:hypothetical protein
MIRSIRNPNPILTASTENNKRRHGRLRCEHLSAVVAGEEACILDLSASGMRVQAHKNPGLKTGQCIRALIGSVLGETSVDVRVIWCIKRGFRRFEIGLTFMELSPQVRGAIASIARMAADTNTFYAG